MIKGYLVLGLINIAALLVLMYMAKTSDVLETRRQKSYLGAIAVTIIIIITEMCTSVFQCGGSGFYFYSVIANVIGFGLSPFIPQILAMVFVENNAKLIKWAMLPNAVNLIMVLMSPFFGSIFEISSENVYSRGPYFIVYVGVYMWSMMVLLKVILGSIINTQRKTRVLMVATGAFVFGGTVIQIIDPEIHATWTCITLALILDYAIICELDNKYDKLTELLNRNVYEWELKQLRSIGCGAVIMFDMDDLKKTNDTYGHLYGDYCLQTLAAAIKDVFSGIGLCFRIGGDEFCVITKKNNEDIILRALEQLIHNIIEFRKSNPNMPMVSYGYAFYNRNESRSVADMIKEADDNLYAYKRKYKGKYGNDIN